MGSRWQGWPTASLAAGSCSSTSVAVAGGEAGRLAGCGPRRKRLRESTEDAAAGCPGSAPRTAAPRLVLEQPVLRLRDGEAEGKVGGSTGELRFQFRHTGVSSVLRAESVAELRAILAARAERAAATQEQWLRQPHARWIADLVDELSPSQRLVLARRHRHLEAAIIPEEDFVGRWGETADFASSVVNLWFEGRSLDEVLARAKDLGHMDGDMASGHLLEGSFIDQLATSADIGFEQLLPMVRKMSGRDDRVSLYKVCAHNCFDLEPQRMQRIGGLRPCDGQGSLNTTWTYGERGRTGIEMMDEYHDAVVEVVEECDAVKLNPRLYMIWKFQHYVTSYHQDTHVPPHMTLYNQVSGVSLFHFLPLLVGLFVTHVGRRDVTRLESVLRELDNAGIGSLCTLGPGQVALITPFGSHGVWVPAVSHNPALPPFSVSLIRAAELYVEPVLSSCRQRHKRKRWNVVFEDLPEQDAEVQQFVAVQSGLCREMSLTSDDWLSLVRKTWATWQAEAALAEADVQEEEEEEEEAEDASSSPEEGEEQQQQAEEVSRAQPTEVGVAPPREPAVQLGR